MTSIIYSDFVNLINTLSLVPGEMYNITDFQTRHYIQYTDSNGDGTALDESIGAGGIEDIIVTALSVDTYDNSVKSLQYPDDYILWTHEVSDRYFDYANSVGKGHILYRKSILGNSRNYDFRGVVFRRWNDGIGNYIVIREVDAPAPLDYVDLLSMEENANIMFNEIGSVGTPSAISVPYYLDNLIISTQSRALGNKIDSSHGVNINVDEFDANKISTILYSDFIGGSMSANLNKVGYMQYTTINPTDAFSINSINSLMDSTIGGQYFSGNIIGSILNSTIGTGSNTNSYNSVVSIDNNTIDSFSGNIGNTIESSVIATMTDNNFNEVIGCVSDTIVDNMSQFINYNTSTIISSNIANIINNNIVGTVSNNTVDIISDNNISGEISYNIGYEIYGNTSSVIDIAYNSVNRILSNTGTSSITNNDGDSISSNSIDGNITGNRVVTITNNTTTNNISSNLGNLIDSNTCDLINANNALSITNNSGGSYETNNSIVIDTNDIINDCSNNNILNISNNQIDSLLRNTGYKYEFNFGDDYYISNVWTGIISDNQISYVSNNTITVGIITSNNLNTFSNNTVTGTSSNNTGYIIDSNTSYIISDNAVSDINNNTINYIYENNGNLIENNIGITGSNVYKNNTHTIKNNTTQYIIENVGYTIKDNDTALIYANDIYQISSNNITSIYYNKLYKMHDNSDVVGNGGVINNNSGGDISSNQNFSVIEYNNSNKINSNIFGSTEYSGAYATFSWSGTPSVGDSATISYGPYSQGVTSTTASSTGFVSQIYNLFPDNGFFATYSSTVFTVTAPTGSVSYDGATFSLIMIGTYSLTANTMFSGTGLDDMTSDVSGYTQSTSTHYLVAISSVGASDTFNWFDSQGNSASNVIVNGLAQTLSYNTKITFASTFGHTVADNWDFDALPHQSLFTATYSQFSGETSSLYSQISYNNVGQIFSNQYCEITYNSGNSIYNNISIDKIIGNELIAITDNYNLHKVSSNTGHRIRGVTGSVGTKYLDINESRNIDIDYSILNGNISNHSFLDKIENLSITPSTNMEYGTYSTVSRYLFDIDGHYEEIANSTGLTWSGPIA